MTRRVGKEVNAEEYWKERNVTYNAGIEGTYHRHRLAMINALIINLEFQDKVCVDYGCGDGILLEHFARKGGKVIGTDIDEVMVRTAQDRLEQTGLKGNVVRGGVETLANMATDSVDNLIAINVLAYFTDQEEAMFYREAARILKRGGSLVVTHSNELFDLYTLNAFTVSFHAKHFSGEEPRSKIASLITWPNRPEKISFNIRENPLAYRFKLTDYGFKEVQQEFANLHLLPPLLMDPQGFIEIDKREYPNTLNWDERERWKLMFMCSMFGSRSIKL
jgi:2-polyprenyl-3-methyl-5-hydroxy-6-metoxy-1,4-benzoquinol methylase